MKWSIKISFFSVQDAILNLLLSIIFVPFLLLSCVFMTVLLKILIEFLEIKLDHFLKTALKNFFCSPIKIYCFVTSLSCLFRHSQNNKRLFKYTVAQTFAIGETNRLFSKSAKRWR